MEKVQSVTFKFDKREDRLILDCRLTKALQAIFMTRRLAFALLQGLGQVLHKQTAQPIHNQNVETTLMSMTHVHALNRVNHAQVNRQTKHSTATALPRLANKLLTQIDIKRTGSSHRLEFRNGDTALCSLELNQAQLHWFVNRIDKFCNGAGWGTSVPSPEWIEAGAAAQTAPAGVPLH